MKAYEIVLRPEFKVKAYCKDGVCCVEVRIPTPYGDLCLKGSYPLRKAAKALHGWWQARSGTAAAGTESGGFLSRLKKLTRQVAQAAALAPVIRSVQQIQKNPILARAVGLTTAVIPGLGSAKIAAEKAANLVQKAARGDVKSLASLNTLRSLVQMGNPQAAEAWRLARVAHQAIKRKAPINFLAGLAPQIAQQAQQVAQMAQAVAPVASLAFPAAAPALALAPQALQAAQAFAPAFAPAFAVGFPYHDTAAEAAGYLGC
jgi:hypothetical protein